jgi:hypothetical protein
MFRLWDRDVETRKVAVERLAETGTATKLTVNVEDPKQFAEVVKESFLEVNEVSAMMAWLVSVENNSTSAGTFDLSGDRATY